MVVDEDEGVNDVLVEEDEGVNDVVVDEGINDVVLNENELAACCTYHQPTDFS